MVESSATSKSTVTIDEAVVRLTGDSGDGMQLTGGQFTATSALMGNDLATFPDYPAEIRAPAGWRLPDTVRHGIIGDMTHNVKIGIAHRRPTSGESGEH